MKGPNIYVEADTDVNRRMAERGRWTIALYRQEEVEERERKGGGKKIKNDIYLQYTISFLSLSSGGQEEWIEPCHVSQRTALAFALLLKNSLE